MSDKAKKFQCIASCLRDGLKNLKITPRDKQKDEEYYFKECLQRDSVGREILKTLSNSSLPIFNKPQNSEENIFKIQLRAEARGYFFERELSRLLTSEELKYLWSVLQDHHILLLNDFTRNQYITYSSFIKIKNMLDENYKLFFNPSIFLQLQNHNSKGYLSIDTFFNYIMKKIWIDQTRNGLSQYDSNGFGYLSEADFEAYVLDLIPSLTQLNKLEKIFYSFYACMVVRKFFFHLDPLRTGKIRIVEILSCGLLDELLELREEMWTINDPPKKNWFSVPSALQIYSSYLELDKDHNGLLNRQEMARYKSGYLTSVFLDKVFQDSFTFDGEMDYKGYLNFVLAMENRHKPQAIRYLFRFLDIKNQGYLDSFTINYFSRAVAERLAMRDQQQAISLDDIKDEIFDMVKPADPAKITLNDLIKSGMGHTVINILVDVNGFCSYEFREALALNRIPKINLNENFSSF